MDGQENTLRTVGLGQEGLALKRIDKTHRVQKSQNYLTHNHTIYSAIPVLIIFAVETHRIQWKSVLERITQSLHCQIQDRKTFLQQGTGCAWGQDIIYTKKWGLYRMVRVLDRLSYVFLKRFATGLIFFERSLYTIEIEENEGGCHAKCSRRGAKYKRSALFLKIEQGWYVEEENLGCTDNFQLTTHKRKFTIVERI